MNLQIENVADGPYIIEQNCGKQEEEGFNVADSRDTLIMSPLTMDELLHDSSQERAMSSLHVFNTETVYGDLPTSDVDGLFSKSNPDESAKHSKLYNQVLMRSALHLASSPTSTPQSPSNENSQSSTSRHFGNHSFELPKTYNSCMRITTKHPREQTSLECGIVGFDTEENCDKSSVLEDDGSPPVAFKDCSSITLSSSSPLRPISARSNTTSVTLTAADLLSDQLKMQLIALHSDNVQLRNLVLDLQQKLEIREAAWSSLAVDQEGASEKVASLLDEVAVGQKTLRDREDQLDLRDMILSEKNQTISSLQQKLKYSQSLLRDNNLQKTSLETARDEARCNASLLSQRLQNANTLMNVKLVEFEKRSCSEINQLKREKREVSLKLEALQHEHQLLQNKLRASLIKLRDVENLNQCHDLSTAKLMDEAQQRIRDLIEEVDDKRSTLKKQLAESDAVRELHQAMKSDYDKLEQESSCLKTQLNSQQRENEELRVKNDNLKVTVSQLKQSLAFDVPLVPSQSNVINDDRPVKDSPGIESPKVISLFRHQSVVLELNMKLSSQEVHIKHLETQLADSASDAEKIESFRRELLTVGEKARSGERRVRELEDVVHLMENERTKYLKKVNDLQDEAQDKCRECDSLEKRLQERTLKLNQAQSHIEELCTKSDATEEELKHLQEKTETMNNEISKLLNEQKLRKSEISELHNELDSKSKELDNLTERSSKQEARYRQEVKRIKKLSVENHEEMRNQVEMLENQAKLKESQHQSSEREVSQLQQILVASGNRVQQLEEEASRLREEGERHTRAHQQALEVLEEKLSLSSGRVALLEGALAQCKEEVTGNIEEIATSHAETQQKLMSRSTQVRQLEAELELAQSSLRDEGSRVVELEEALEERHKMLEDAAGRVAELEESQAALQALVSSHEQTRSRDAARTDELVSGMEEKLRAACRELDSKNRAFAQLNDALGSVDEEFRACKEEVAKLEVQVEELRRANEEKSQDAARWKFERDAMKAKLDGEIENVAKMETSHREQEREFRKIEERKLKLEGEVEALTRRHQMMAQRVTELQSGNEVHEAELLQKDKRISHLQEELRLCGEERDDARANADELQRKVESRQAELQCRAQQLAELESQLRGFERGLGSRNSDLERRLNEAEAKLRERSDQVARLDEKLVSLRRGAAELRRTLEEERENSQRLEKIIVQKNECIDELSEAIHSGRQSREERHNACIEASQEVRLAGEREQEMSKRYQECHRQLLKLKRNHEQLLNSLDDTAADDRAKKDELLRLNNQLAKLKADHAAMETRYRDELERTQRDIIKMKSDHDDEVSAVRAASDELRQEDGRRATDDLERELAARRQAMETSNDVIIVKDVEIARLQAKLSAAERQSTMLLREGENVDPPALPWSVDDVSSTSLFASMDSNMTSFAASFVPIAASTRRPPLEELPMLSPNHRTGALEEASEGEDSLCKRVFNDIFPSSPRDAEEADAEFGPEKCMAELNRKLRASEERRRGVSSKLRRLKS